jgi:hypothetical protein
LSRVDVERLTRSVAVGTRLHPGEILPLPVFPSGDLGYSGTRDAVGLGYRFTVYKRTLPRAPSRWFGFIANSRGLLKLKAMVLTGLIKSQTKLASELEPVAAKSHIRAARTTMSSG